MENEFGINNKYILLLALIIVHRKFATWYDKKVGLHIVQYCHCAPILISSNLFITPNTYTKKSFGCWNYDSYVHTVFPLLGLLLSNKSLSPFMKSRKSSWKEEIYLSNNMIYGFLTLNDIFNCTLSKAHYPRKYENSEPCIQVSSVVHHNVSLLGARTSNRF